MLCVLAPVDTRWCVAVPPLWSAVRDPARLFTAPHPATDQHCSPPHRLRAPEYARCARTLCVPNPGAAHRRFI